MGEAWLTCSGAKILMTGPTGQVGFPLAVTLARDNEVWARRPLQRPDGARRARGGRRALRHRRPRRRRPRRAPGRLDYVLNFAVAKTGQGLRPRPGRRTSEAIGLLMHHCRTAQGVPALLVDRGLRAERHHDAAQGDRPARRQPPACRLPADLHHLQDRGRGDGPLRRPASSDLPTTIARLNVPYGDNGGWPAFHLEMMLAGQPVPVHTDAPSLVQPDPRGRHRRAGADAARRRVGARDDRELGRQRRRQHRGVVRVPRRARPGSSRSSSRPTRRSRASRSTPRGCTSWSGKTDGRLARRLPPHGRGPSPRAAQELRRTR